MLVTYGDVRLQCERVYRWEARAVYDESGVDFLYFHVVFSVQAILHPAATRSNDLTGKPIVNGYGEHGAVSYRDLRQVMLTPRLPLQVRLGNEVILQSPAKVLLRAAGPPAGPLLGVLERELLQPCDAKNGPQPLSFHVVTQFANSKSLIVLWECETWVNDLLDPAKTPALLSNRWSLTETIDTLGYATRHVRGRAVFRADLLRGPIAAGAEESWPGDYLACFNFPVPDNHQREGVEVTQSPDGTALDYGFRDVQRSTQIDPDSPVRRFTGRLRILHHNNSLFWFAHRRVSITMEVHGRPGAARQDLINFLERVAATFDFKDGAGIDGPGNYTGRIWDIDLAERRVSCELWVDVSGAVDSAWVFANTNLLQHRLGNFSDDISPPDLGADGPNPTIGAASNVRGQYFYRLVSQALTRPNEVPPRPPENQAPKKLALYGAGGYRP